VKRELHPAEIRGLRELYAFSRQLVDHWSDLAERIGAETPTAAALRSGAGAARELLGELEPVTAGYDLHGRPAAQGLGGAIARQRTAVRDRFLERGQAVRFAVEEIVHLCVLLGYLARAAQAADDSELADFCLRWERKLRRHEGTARKAAAELGADPGGAIEPLHGSGVGKALHGVGYALGTAGEWFDRRASRRGS